MLARQTFSRLHKSIPRHLSNASPLRVTQQAGYQFRTMATGNTVHLTPATAGTHHVATGITSATADKASELLQMNHDRNHIFFNTGGFHNHIAHHLLAIYALGATTDQLQHAFDNNQGYQRAQYPINERNVENLSDPEKWKASLGKEELFHDFEEYFRKEIDEKGWQEVVKEYLLKGDERSEDLLIRMFAGFYHPIIHLGYGIEFQQPAIIAEGLAQAAVHTDWIGAFLTPLTPTNFQPPKDATPTPLPSLLNECRSNPKLLASPHEEDGNKLRDGVLKRAPQEMLAIAKKWWIPRPLTQEAIDRALAESTNNCVWFAGGAQRSDREVKFDFFYMHCVNLSVFYQSIVGKQNTWLSLEDKARLLENKARCDLALWVSRGCPELDVERIKSYQSRSGKEDDWEGIIKRVNAIPDDDGHAAKLVRALMGGERVCAGWEGELGEDRMVIRGDMWRKLGNMAIDSVEGGGPTWVRNAGWESAWKEVPVRKGSRL